MIKKILSIETSCDDTSVAIVDATGWVHAVVSATKDLDHAPYGGIVPEIASRNHSIALLPLIDEVLKKTQLTFKDLDGIAVTNRPGLVGALIVGLVTAKTLSQAHQLPFIGVNHLEGHLLAPFLRDESYSPSFDYQTPFLAMAISGGHTTLYLVKGLGQYHILGATKDDAAGEAFDKFAKMAGLGFPGGVKVDQLAQQGQVDAFDFPRSMINDPTYDMSFSGLKSSAQRLLESMTPDQIQSSLPDLCASYQEAIVEVLLKKIGRAVKEHKISNIVITGGVSANSHLRAKATEWARRRKLNLLIPPLRYCTDNAAMIGYAGILRLLRGESSGMGLGPSPQSLEEDFIYSDRLT